MVKEFAKSAWQTWLCMDAACLKRLPSALYVWVSLSLGCAVLCCTMQLNFSGYILQLSCDFIVSSFVTMKSQLRVACVCLKSRPRISGSAHLSRSGPSNSKKKTFALVPLVQEGMRSALWAALPGDCVCNRCNFLSGRVYIPDPDPHPRCLQTTLLAYCKYAPNARRASRPAMLTRRCRFTAF